MERIVEVEDYEPLALERLPKDVYDFIAGGAGDEWTLARNRRSFERWMLRPRVLRGVAEPDTRTEVLGVPLSSPVMIAPWAYQRLVHPEGEPATARAAARAGTLAVISTTAEGILEATAAASAGPKWWQLYLFKDRAFSEAMLRRAVEAGYGAIMFTVDLPVFSIRYRDIRNEILIPDSVQSGGGEWEAAIAWSDIPWIKECTGLPLLIKGILTPEDARLAIDAGVDGIVVSNHGGRQLDGAPGSMDVLPEIVEAVAGRIPVLLDGGVRRGTDVLKAVAVGAAAVMIGRPAAWGLAVDGEDGVVRVLEVLREELANAMALMGCRTVSDITSDLVTLAPDAD